MAGGRGREKRTSPASWMQSVGLEDREHWKEIFWMERYDHGKAGEHKTGPWSCETPTKLEEEASVLGRYLLLMQRGLRAGTRGKGAQDTVTAPSNLEGGDRRSDALVSEGHMFQGIKIPTLSQQNCSVPAARGGGGVFASHHTSLLGLISSPFLLTCSHLL